MSSKRISTFLLVMIMLCSITLCGGCGSKNNNNDKKDDPDVVDNNNGNNNDDNKQDDNKTPVNEDKTDDGKKVTLLKRNGVEWKENTKINSARGAQKYTVVWGDTLSLIARTWNVDTYTLAKYNGIKNIDLIEVGQVIYNYTYKG